jgi:hypothetical protein
MRYVKCLALLSTLTLLSPVLVFARDKNQHSVDIANPVLVGTTQLKPGTYKVEWQDAGPMVRVKFFQSGKAVATAPATLKTNNPQVTQNDVVTRTTSANKNVLEEIDFEHQKESLVFGNDQSNM